MSRTRAALGSATFLILAPGVVAGLVPYLLTEWDARETSALYVPVAVVGGALALAGVAALLHSFGRFVLEGSGTPAPVAPTSRLVVGGLYRHCRNPMYVAVVSIILGQGLLLAQPVLLAYAALMWATFASFVAIYEQPTLRRDYGEEYAAYCRAVPAWRPRLRPWTGRVGAVFCDEIGATS